MTMTFYEYRSLGGWHPCTSHTRPNVINGWLVLASGPLHPVRNVCDVEPEDERLPLTVLQRLYGGAKDDDVAAAATFAGAGVGGIIHGSGTDPDLLREDAVERRRLAAEDAAK